jgi:hypothetical protein
MEQIVLPGCSKLLILWSGRRDSNPSEAMRAVSGLCKLLQTLDTAADLFRPMRARSCGRLENVGK